MSRLKKNSTGFPPVKRSTTGGSDSSRNSGRTSTSSSVNASTSGGVPMSLSQRQRQLLTTKLAKKLPPGIVSMILPATVGAMLPANPRYDSSAKLSFKPPAKAGAVGQPNGINSKYKPVNRGFSYSFPGMFQDTGIGSLEKEAKRRDAHIDSAKKRLERLEKLKIVAEEKRRIRDALRAKKRADKARFHYAVTALQAAFRGSRDRHVFNEELYIHRQKMRAIHAIQSAMRGQKGRAVAHQRKVVIVGAAKKIQRRYSARLQYIQAQKDIEKMLQEREAARARALEQFQEECATQLQAFFRGVKDREMVEAKKRKRRKKLKSLKSREADMKKKLAAMAGGKKKAGSRRSSASSKRGRSAKKKK